MPGYPDLTTVPGEFGDQDANLLDDGLRVILAQLRGYGVHVIMGAAGSRPAASPEKLGRWYVATDASPRVASVDVGTRWVDVVDAAITDTSPTYNADWTNDSDAAAWRDGTGHVYLGGYLGHTQTITSAVPADGLGRPMGTLPAGFRPTRPQEILAGYVLASDGSLVGGVLRVETNGVMKIRRSSGASEGKTPGRLLLDGLSFDPRR